MASQLLETPYLIFDFNSFHLSTMAFFRNYGWHGNIRELKHAVERAAVLAIKGRILLKLEQ